MDAAYFNKLFEYDYWSNKEVLKALEASKNPPEKALQLLSHILAAERVWYARLMEQDSSKLHIWPEHSLEECQKMAGEVFRNWISYLDDLSAKRLNEKILYWNSKGTAFETAIGDILTHVAIHGGYHRGQIAALLRQADAKPAVTDYIAYVRSL